MFYKSERKLSSGSLTMLEVYTASPSFLKDSFSIKNSFSITLQRKKATGVDYEHS